MTEYKKTRKYKVITNKRVDGVFSGDFIVTPDESRRGVDAMTRAAVLSRSGAIDGAEHSPAGAVFMLEIESREIAAAAPGQFVMIKCGAGPRYDKGRTAFLRRPISVGDANAATGVVRFYYRVAGAGTYWMSYLQRGDMLDIMGPLGNGFRLSRGRVAIVGGGVGVFPLLFLAKRFNEVNVVPDIYTGFQNAGAVLLHKEFRQLANEYTLATDDGSAGQKGFITDIFDGACDTGARYDDGVKYDGGVKYDAVYACGPQLMIDALHKICTLRGIKAQYSLEQRMGCGIGACLTCACAVKAPDGNTGVVPAFAYARACKDGPVFSSSEYY